MKESFESAELVGDRVMIVTTQKYIILSLDGSGAILCDNMRRPHRGDPEAMRLPDDLPDAPSGLNTVDGVNVSAPTRAEIFDRWRKNKTGGAA